MPIPLIPILLQAASLAPALMKFMNAGSTAEKVAANVAELATTISGEGNPKDALIAISGNSEKLQQFQLAVNTQMQEWDAMFLADVQSARDRDIKLAQVGYRNYRAHAMFGLAVLVVFILVYLVWDSDILSEYTKGIFTLVLGRFLGYLDNMYNFEFGTTRQSRSKDDTIEKLTRNGS